MTSEIEKMAGNCQSPAIICSTAALPSFKSERVTKIVWMDVIGPCYIKSFLVSSVLLHYEISLHCLETKLTKLYLASVVKL